MPPFHFDLAQFGAELLQVLPRHLQYLATTTAILFALPPVAMPLTGNLRSFR